MGWELGDETCLTTPPFIRSRDALAAAGSGRTRHAAAGAGRPASKKSELMGIVRF